MPSRLRKSRYFLGRGGALRPFRARTTMRKRRLCGRAQGPNYPRYLRTFPAFCMSRQKCTWSPDGSAAIFGGTQSGAKALLPALRPYLARRHQGGLSPEAALNAPPSPMADQGRKCHVAPQRVRRPNGREHGWYRGPGLRTSPFQGRHQRSQISRAWPART